MASTLRLSGRIVSGVAQAAFFTQLPWVQDQCEARLGFRPYPGTLNLRLDGASADLMASVRNLEAVTLEPPGPEFCVGKALPAIVGGLKGALLLPEERVNVHGAQIIEVIAPVSIKDALGLRDGDQLTVLLSGQVQDETE